MRDIVVGIDGSTTSWRALSMATGIAARYGARVHVCYVSHVPVPVDMAAFALPVARPGKIVCLGLNYLEHAKEGGHQKPEFPTVFMRCLTSLTPHLAPIVRPFASETLDYEAELLVVIGRRRRAARVAPGFFTK